MIPRFRILLLWESWRKRFLVLIIGLVLLLLNALAFLVFRIGVLLVVKLELLLGWLVDWVVRLLAFVDLRDIVIVRLALSQMHRLIHFGSMFNHNLILVICTSLHHLFPQQLTDWRCCELHWAGGISSYWFKVVDLLRYGWHTWSCVHLLHQWHYLLFEVMMRLLELRSGGNHTLSVLCVCIVLLLYGALAMWYIRLRRLLRRYHLWFTFLHFTACFASSLPASLFIWILIVIFEVFQLNKCNLPSILWAHQILIASRQLSSTLWFNHVPRLNQFLFFAIWCCHVSYNRLILAMGIRRVIQCLEAARFHYRDVSSKIWLAFLKNGLNLSFFDFSFCRCTRATTLLFFVTGLVRELWMV